MQIKKSLQLLKVVANKVDETFGSSRYSPWLSNKFLSSWGQLMELKALGAKNQDY